MSMLQIGDEAPAFCLPNQVGTEICLRDLRGAFVILYFYPRDLTPGCTTEACDFNVNLKEFLKLGASVLGVSADSIESHQKFATKKELSFDLLSDSHLEVCHKYGVWGEKKLYGKIYEGVHRTTFLIDPEGKIAFIWKKVKVKGHIQAVLEKLQALNTSSTLP